jgi:HEAT repeat protein
VEEIMDLRKILRLEKPDIKKMEREGDIKGLTRLLKFEQDESVRREAAFAIGKITGPNSGAGAADENLESTKQSVEELITSLRSDDTQLQKQATMKLVEIGNPSVKPLLKSLKDPNWKIRWYASEVLGKIGDERAVAGLIETMGDENSGVRSKSLIALVEIGEPSVDPLIRALSNDNWQIRRQAAETLGVIGLKKSVEPLIHTLEDENSWVRKTAAESLGNIGDRRAVNPLKNLLKDDSLEVQAVVSDALEKLG